MRRTLFGAACLSLQPVLLSALMLPATAYVIRTLGPKAYGQWVTATTLVAVTSFLTNLGLRGTFVRAVARDPASAPQALADQLGLRVALAVLASILTVGACLLLGYPPVVIVCTILTTVGLTLNAFATTLWDLLQAVHRLPAVAGINLTAGLVLTAASVVLAWLGTGPVGVAAAYQVGPLVSAGLSLWVVAGRHGPVRLRFSVRRSIRLLWESRFFAAQQLVGSAAGNAEALLVPRLLGAEAFGFFAAGTLLPTRLAAIPDGVGTAAYPAIAAAGAGQRRAVSGTVARYLLIVVVACIAAAAGVAWLAHPIAELLFPGRGEPCRQVMAVAIWMLPLMGVHCLLGYALNALGQDAQQAKASAFGAGLSLLLTSALVWRFGLVGAAWSMILRYGLYLAALAPCLVKTFAPSSSRATGSAVHLSPRVVSCNVALDPSAA